MAYLKKTKTGWRADVQIGAHKKSKSGFQYKKDAEEWASEYKKKFTGKSLNDGTITLENLFDKYAQEISPKHKGERWEITRIEAFKKSGLPIGAKVVNIDSKVFVDYRDMRLKSVKQSTVIRELNLLGAIFETARVEWKYISSNPVRDVKKPTAPPHRDRLLKNSEIKGVLRALKYSPLKPILSKQQSVAATFLFALRTGMRSGEICDLKWDRVKEDESFLHLPDTKNGKKRDVPLSQKAIIILKKMKGFHPVKVFDVSDSVRDVEFRDARDKAGLKDFTFHDSRHYAAVKISKKVGLIELCRIFGWTDPKMAMVYYSETASNLAKLLN
jgi:integrase